jgi:hypothetical protein
VKPKPDPRALKRAETQLRRDNEPRRLEGFTEPRLSHRDERDLADAARRRNREATSADLLAALANMAAELEFVKARLGQVTPGDHRGYLRSIEHGIAGLQRAL